MLIGQRQFLGFVFSSQVKQKWIPSFLAKLNSAYQCVEGKIVYVGAAQGIPSWRSWYPSFKYEWALGGVPGCTGWYGLDNDDPGLAWEAKVFF